MEGDREMIQHLSLKKIINDGNDDDGGREDNLVVMMEGVGCGGGDGICDQSNSIATSMDDSANSSISSSIFSTSSSLQEEVDDASSSSSPASTSSSSNGPLYELSALTAQLPVKRGLSKFYQGKSQSFTSLANANSIEDLAKKGNNNISSYKMRMKSCKSCAAGLDGHHHKSISPKPTISKKSSKGSLFLSSLGKRSSLVTGGRPAICVQRNF